MSSPLTPTILPPTGSVETAQPIRTMAIIIEGRGREEGGAETLCVEGGEEDDEEGVEEVEAAEEQEEDQLEVSVRATVHKVPQTR